jgi:hypothetical protein
VLRLVRTFNQPVSSTAQHWVRVYAIVNNQDEAIMSIGMKVEFRRLGSEEYETGTITAIFGDLIEVDGTLRARRECFRII